MMSFLRHAKALNRRELLQICHAFSVVTGPKRMPIDQAMVEFKKAVVRLEINEGDNSDVLESMGEHFDTSLAAVYSRMKANGITVEQFFSEDAGWRGVCGLVFDVADVDVFLESKSKTWVSLRSAVARFVESSTTGKVMFEWAVEHCETSRTNCRRFGTRPA